MKKIIWSIFLITCFLIVKGQSQNIQITGRVTNQSDGSPMIGATISVKGLNAGTLSDANGRYNITAPSNGTLLISYVGFGTLSEPIDGRNEINSALISEEAVLDQVIVVGTRRPGRVLLETPVPVDVVNVKQIMATTARMDLTSILNYSAPSMNYNKQSGSDGADHIDLATLRGLGPDQSLVLINGKRRHQTAFVAVFGTRGRGNSGTDLNAFPAAAIDRVEILRDGASAQYGSDALAGVMNLILKRSTNELSLNAGFSGYYDDDFNPAFMPDNDPNCPNCQQYIFEKKLDGIHFALDANYGLKLGNDGGFLNLTANFIDAGKTYRQSLIEDFNDEYGLPINIYRRAHGDGSLDLFGGFLNAEYPLAGNTSLYAFGGYNFKKSDAYAFTRNFSARPDRFVTDSSSGAFIESDIIKKSSDAETAGADAYYNPHIQTEVKDMSGTIGVKGTFTSGWLWDVSNVVGKNDFHFFGDKTFNASLNDATKNHFDDGGFSFLQNTSNLNLSKSFSGILSGFSLGTGAEFRYENYNLFAGEEASYKNYQEGKATGSQGFPGYQPNDEVDANRNAIGVYLDAELDLTKKWLLGTALRFENYSDFGSTLNYKLATRYKIEDNFNLRASFSTGFRAPSLQQINFSSTFTTVQGGQISEVKIAPNFSPITKAAGIPELKQEESVNASVGFTTRLTSGLSVTYDFYYVQIYDRVVLSGQFDAEDATLNPILTNELKRLNVGLAQFFANAVNTTNKGFDIVIDYNKKIQNNRFRVIALGNFQRMSIDKVNIPDVLNSTESHRAQFLSDREKAFILASAPEIKTSLNLEYGYKTFGIGLRGTYFGNVRILGYGEDGLGINPMVPGDNGSSFPDEYLYGGKFVTDAYASLQLTKNIGLNIGVDNLFNIHPDLGAVNGAKWWAYNNETGGPWDAVQMGGNGMRLFARLGLNF
ncbi:MAG: TonB-dependent receptor [Bacteroidota bacterium]|nr:TonB-dependent receptor [Bacteroidota bacterium]